MKFCQLQAANNPGMIDIFNFVNYAVAKEGHEILGVQDDFLEISPGGQKKGNFP
jgi:hypothetical protein